ncbi:NUDIX hydrolase [Ruegeria sp. SCP11]|uniref:NUDIX hydrolase n=1 Tax=Ruegeria sp. SCP11 TaxID=3141378 RepID=UPI003335495C
MKDARLSPHVSPKARQLPVLQQLAALCYRFERGRPEVLLITTRKSRRWIIPKGWLIDGLTPPETALQEAWEEAGVRGKCDVQAIGRFFYQKRRRKKGPVMCAVDVFPLLATSIASRFPEYQQRQRKWITPKKAAQLVNSPELALLLQKIEPVRH